MEDFSVNSFDSSRNIWEVGERYLNFLSVKIVPIFCLLDCTHFSPGGVSELGKIPNFFLFFETLPKSLFILFFYFIIYKIDPWVLMSKHL